VDPQLTKRLTDWLEYMVLRNACCAFQIFPWPVGRRMARIFGRLAYCLDRGRRKANASENICRAFPNMTRAEARDLLKRVYCHLACTILDGFHFARFVRHWEQEDLFETEGFEKLEGVQDGTGIVFVTGHFGQWEVLGAVAPLIGYPVWSMGRTFDNVFIEDYIRRLREITGQRMLGKHGALRQMVRLVEKGQHVAMLIDQDARRHGMFAEFFGRPASTTTAPARLAIRTGAPVAFVYGQRIAGENRFRIVLTDVVQPRSDGDRQSETRRITQRITRDMEEVVRQSPEQWLWLHRRWKTYPGKYGRQ
jgi:KDO2-lipid IV(A) lauroyltransferase